MCVWAFGLVGTGRCSLSTRASYSMLLFTKGGSSQVHTACGVPHPGKRQGGPEKFWKIWVGRVPGLQLPALRIDRHDSTTTTLRNSVNHTMVFLGEPYNSSLMNVSAHGPARGQRSSAPNSSSYVDKGAREPNAVDLED